MLTVHKSPELSSVLSRAKSLRDVAFGNGIDPVMSRTRDIHSHTHIDAIHAKNDDELLAEIGYKPELRRYFTPFQVFGVAYSIMGLLPSIASVISQSFVGGPASAVWGWIIACSFIFLVGICMSELASAIPTSGGLYYWTYHYAPEKLKIPLSFLVGNTNTVALTSCFCSVDYGLAKQIYAIAYIAKDGDFNITNGSIYGLYAALIISHVFIACVASAHVAKLQSFSSYSNTALVILFIVAMLVSKKNDFNSASFVFTQIDDFTDWTKGWTFVMDGFMPAIWAVGAFDSCVHMSEEATNSSKSVPIGILAAIATCSLLGWVVIIVCALCIDQDINAVINTASGQPMAQIIYDAMGKRWAIAIMSLIAFCQWLMGASGVTATSRQIWAFSRDNGLLFSSIVKVVNKRLSVPLRAVAFAGVLALIMGLLCLIGTTAANALFTLFVCGNYFAWQTPIMLRLYRSFGSEEYRFKPGNFYLGDNLSPLVNWTAVIFTNFTIIMAMFPSSKAVSKETMNYTVVITCATWLLSMCYYYFFAHKAYYGPRNTIDDLDDTSSDDPAIDELLESTAHEKNFENH